MSCLALSTQLVLRTLNSHESSAFMAVCDLKEKFLSLWPGVAFIFVYKDRYIEDFLAVCFFDQVYSTMCGFPPVEQASNPKKEQLITPITVMPLEYKWPHLA